MFRASNTQIDIYLLAYLYLSEYGVLELLRVHNRK